MYEIRTPWLDGDPIGAAARLTGRPGRVLLHSGRDDDGCGQWSFAACEPTDVVSARGRRVTVTRGGVSERGVGADPLEALATLVEDRDPGARGENPAPIAIGYLGYDVGRVIEHLPNAPTGGPDVPDLWFGIYDAVWRHDGATGDSAVVARTRAAAERLCEALATDARLGPPPALGPLRADDRPAEYRDRVARILSHIAAGEVYQVNLARRLTAPVRAAGDPLAVYATVHACAPAPYGAVIELPGAAVISGSPERFLHRAPGADRLETRPIKGTRRRTGDPDRDRALADELLADAKERAEHLMIVDLLRNDLGRIACTGTVAVDALGYPVTLPGLLHLVSRVSCRLRPDVRLPDIVRATFPGGSITGAPKIRAMQIIDELEPTRRGPYTGAIGYVGAGGALDLSIAIRGALLADRALHLHVGGGIVADSRPDRELEETEEKAAGWRAALTALAARAPVRASPRAG